MTSLLSTLFERWVACKSNARSESPTPTELPSSFAKFEQLEQLLLLSASPLGEAEIASSWDPSSFVVAPDGSVRYDGVSDEAFIYFDEQADRFRHSDSTGDEDVESEPPDSPSDDVVVLNQSGTLDLSGEHGDHLEITHSSELEIAEGTVALHFTADDVWGYHALFSKDFSGNRDGGDLTAFVKDGRVKVRFQSADSEVWLHSAEGSVLEGEENHFALTFGDDGVWLYLNGQMTDWELEFKQGLDTNTQNLVIGANTWSRTEDHPDQAWHHFDGQIRDFVIYDSQYDYEAVATLAGNPPAAPLTDPTVIDGVLHGTDNGETLNLDAFGVTEAHGGYGDDHVIGTSGNDVIRGGHGEDILEGGDGDDWLVSYADGREPRIAQEYNVAEDDPDGEIDPESRTHYPYQPIEGDDVLIGGAGADTFYFRTLINAKRDIILKHVNDDGTIEWGMGGVAGENDEVHDHWVERLGDEVINDFSRAEGDRILIEGHTTEVYKLEHTDLDQDGVLDSTILHLWSNQGNGGGAHNKDLLGTITVVNALVTEYDYDVVKTDHGFVDTIQELNEALTPRVYTSIGDTPTPPPLPVIQDGDLPTGAAFAVSQELDLSGEHGDHIEVAHTDALELSEGTISLSFTADDIWGYHTLFSKDFSGNRDGGDLTAFVKDGRVKVRFQSADSEVWLRSAEGSVLEGEENHFALTFGDDGVWLYLNGQMTDWELEFDQGLDVNTQNMAIGANTWHRSADHPYRTWDNFDGQIRDFVIYDSQYDYEAVATLAGNPPAAPLTDPTVIDGVLHGTDNGETLNLDAFGVTEAHGGYGDDHVIGTSGNDVIRGGHGEDILEGGDGDDWLVSYADGREPRIAQEYNVAEDDPDGEIDPESRTHYPYQPIEGDDVLIGGAGADTFYFRTLINAKRDIILKHVNDDGTIEWGMGGVAGENDEVHDHWVERLGDEVINDFSRAEGDRILIEGHTTEVYKLEHTDLDQDGVLDSTILHLWSNQGNGGGAHNKDLLGTITVVNALVTEYDYDVVKTDHGFVDTIQELNEALTPRVYTSIGDTPTPPPLPVIQDGDLPAGAVFAVSQELDLSGEHGDHIEVAHNAAMELAEGTIAFSFVADDIFGTHTLFSKDFSGNRDGGDLTAFVRDGRVKVRFQSADSEVWLYSPQGSIREGEENHFALTFGDDGVWLYLNGQMTDWELEFKQGLDVNTQNMAIGANTWHRDAECPDHTWDNFDGQIRDFVIYDSQYDYEAVATLAGNPPAAPLTDPTVIDGVLHGTDNGETLNLDAFGVTEAHGGYGDDHVIGTSGNDVIRGGHGEDILEGGDGDDWLVSYADGREPRIAQEYNVAEDDPDGEIDPESRTHYPYQPIEGDDVLIGGAGADTFYFRTLINAKRDIILKHVNDDGTIEWGMGGVAGENDEVHDHWVERLGDEVINDFSRAEGDRILIEGHTTEVYKLEHTDLDQDGVLDSTILHLWSNQGNGGGAHNKDLLGTITVVNALVTEYDYDVVKTDHGFVDTIQELNEALTPRVYTSIGDTPTPPPLPVIQDGDLPTGAVIAVLQELDLSGEHGDHIEVAHTDALELSEGTISLNFTADDIWGYHTLFSKDFSGNRDGGDLTAFVKDGRVKVRFQSADSEVWLDTGEGSISLGESYDLSLSFGDEGVKLFLDGELMAWNAEFTQGLDVNTQNLVIGANTWSRSNDQPYRTSEHFDGQINNFLIYDTQLPTPTL